MKIYDVLKIYEVAPEALTIIGIKLFNTDPALFETSSSEIDIFNVVSL